MAIDKYITTLYQLSEHCGYGDVRTDLIQDHIVIRVRDKRLSTKLQMEDGLTLVSIKRQHEYVKQEQAALQQEGAIGEPSEAVGFIQSKQKKMAKPFKPRNIAPTHICICMICFICMESFVKQMISWFMENIRQNMMSDLNWC